ncbi:lipid droplet assembly factor 1 isoform X2 [Hippopotamus amphibius kiboko]|uniref:lipid droplet assembly factor 1 isoform X2 n=1 Tax=Hippopotamus amphibius kiboko TaxID=575201 RepID=UPI002595CD54|nr:lipid droplet assembly factor 1 isoform X2 [Hippopotamus amphibius kiboko]
MPRFCHLEAVRLKVVAFMTSPVGQYLDRHPFLTLTLLVFVAVSAVPVGFFLLLVVLTTLAAFVGVILLEDQITVRKEMVAICSGDPSGPFYGFPKLRAPRVASLPRGLWTRHFTLGEEGEHGLVISVGGLSLLCVLCGLGFVSLVMSGTIIVSCMVVSSLVNYWFSPRLLTQHNSSGDCHLATKSTHLEGLYQE